MQTISKRNQRRTDITGYTFLLPSLIGLLCFSLLPLLFSLFISLTDWNYLKGIGNWDFTGLKNFITLFEDEWFIAALKNTLLFTVVTVPVSLVISLVLAALIDTYCLSKIAGIVRISLYMPTICNVVATAAVWKALYSSYGPFTLLMKFFGWLDPPKWLANYEWALPAIMLVAIWSSLGYRVFIYSAAIQGLPKELFEAADIDGANTVQKFSHITVPLLSPTTFFLTITGIISSFKVFGTVNIMTGGGPGYSTYTMVFYIYKTAFSYYKMGYASSAAVVLFVLLLLITIYQWKHNNRKELKM